MRPAGEIRQALRSAAQTLAVPERNGATWRDLAAHAQVGFDAAKQTVRDMAAAGELVPIGTVRADHASRPMVRYAVAATQQPARPQRANFATSWGDACSGSGGMGLDALTRSWTGGRR